jgi:hypothetical protein
MSIFEALEEHMFLLELKSIFKLVKSLTIKNSISKSLENFSFNHSVNF